MPNPDWWGRSQGNVQQRASRPVGAVPREVIHGIEWGDIGPAQAWVNTFAAVEGQFEDQTLEAWNAISTQTAFLRKVKTRDLIQTINKENQRSFLRLLQAHRKSLVRAWGFYLTANTEQLVNQIKKWDEDMRRRTFTTARGDFAPMLKPLLKGAITLVAEMQSEGAFPQEYVPPIMRAIDAMPDPVIHGQQAHWVFVELGDIFKYLGDINELEKAYHYGAVYEKGYMSEDRFGKFWVSIGGKYNYEGERVELPWEYGSDTSSLKTQSAYRRHRYWKALFNHQSSFYTTFKARPFGKNETTEARQIEVKIPPEFTWEKTKKARLKAWENTRKAPQWIWLEYGKAPDYDPKMKDIGDKASAASPLIANNLRVRGRGANPSPEELVAAFGSTWEGGSVVLPGNVTGIFLQAASELWTRLIMTAWGDEQDKLNRTPTPGPAPATPHTVNWSVYGRDLDNYWKQLVGFAPKLRQVLALRQRGYVFGEGIWYKSTPWGLRGPSGQWVGTPVHWTPFRAGWASNDIEMLE